MADNIVIRDSTLPGVFKEGPLLTATGKVPLTDLDTTGAVNTDVITLVGGVWAPAAAGAGSSDTASNVGVGSQVFKTKVGADFQFRTLTAGLNVTVTQNANDISISTSSSGIFTEDFTSTDQVITATGALTIAHGMASTPTLFQSRIKCTSIDAGYAVNDEVIVDCGPIDFTTGGGTAIRADATNIFIRYGAGNVFGVLHKTTGVVTVIDSTKWVYIIKAWV